MRNEISVVVPCFNAERFILDAVESAVRQEGVETQIVVVDDGSSDKSAGVVKERFPNVQVIRSVHLGASYARNLGTKVSEGAYIQYLDADDLLAPGKLAAQVELLRRTGADVAYGGWLKFRTRGRRCEVDEVISHRITGCPEISLFTDFWCPPAAYLFKREIVDRVGGWKESLPVIQDARFALDCVLYGGRFAYCPGLMALYRTGSSDSLSRKDSMAFVKDCLANADDIEKWWRTHGGLTRERVVALVKAYAYVARASYPLDRIFFEKALAHLEKLSPGYVPREPRVLGLLSRLIGYRAAEEVAMRYRGAKGAIRRAVGSGQ